MPRSKIWGAHSLKKTLFQAIIGVGKSLSGGAQQVLVCPALVRVEYNFLDTVGNEGPV